MNDDNLKKYDNIDKVKLNIEKLHSEKDFKTVSTKEALKYVSPMKWNENVYNGKMKVIIESKFKRLCVKESSKKLYEGWEIIKLLSEGKLKEGTKLINNNNWVYEVKYDGESYYIKNEEEWDVSVSYFTNDAYFKILEEG